MNYLVLPKGHRFVKPGYPSGEGWVGYELAEDVTSGDPILARQFIPKGNVQTPRDGDTMPSWLQEAVWQVKQAAEARHNASGLTWAGDSFAESGRPRSFWGRLRSTLGL